MSPSYIVEGSCSYNHSTGFFIVQVEMTVPEDIQTDLDHYEIDVFDKTEPLDIKHYLYVTEIREPVMKTFYVPTPYQGRIMLNLSIKATAVDKCGPRLNSASKQLHCTEGNGYGMNCSGWY